jgi:hypothetical protein
MPAIDIALAEFLLGPNALLLGTRDGLNVPAITRPAACQVSPDREHITLFVVDDPADRAVPSLRENGMLALVVARPTSYETYQLKGTDGKVEEVRETDRVLIADYRARLIDEMTRVGLSPENASQLLPGPTHSLVRVIFSPIEIYRQTPGPGAGERRGS